MGRMSAKTVRIHLRRQVLHSSIDEECSLLVEIYLGKMFQEKLCTNLTWCRGKKKSLASALPIAVP